MNRPHRRVSSDRAVGRGMVRSCVTSSTAYRHGSVDLTLELIKLKNEVSSNLPPPPKRVPNIKTKNILNIYLRTNSMRHS